MSSPGVGTFEIKFGSDRWTRRKNRIGGLSKKMDPIQLCRPMVVTIKKLNLLIFNYSLENKISCTYSKKTLLIYKLLKNFTYN